MEEDVKQVRSSGSNQDLWEPAKQESTGEDARLVSFKIQEFNYDTQ